MGTPEVNIVHGRRLGNPVCWLRYGKDEIDPETPDSMKIRSDAYVRCGSLLPGDASYVIYDRDDSWLVQIWENPFTDSGNDGSQG